MLTNDNLRIAVLGAGRMGGEILRAIAADARLEVAGVWMRSNNLESVLESGDVAVDFTLPAATPQIIDAVVRLHKPLVCGVSGLGDDIMARMRAASSSVPIFHDRNMSFGIAVLTELVRRAGAALGPEFVAGIHETHHVHKVDAPSGTALKLGEALAEVRGKDFSSVYRFAEGGSARRTSSDQILFSAVRKGENPGEHTVTFRSEAETLELTHKVVNRRVFALGALEAARWLLRQGPGFYGMSDLLERGGEANPDRP
ncbi:MAG TPA: 4-hydroxy-tetrahydrodipicolinate reductase [Woeseiaceae bacterium]|nr:4-hydroxy-tetrahydrodipicolinate reductase [Woeseiaceae bacterium]